jgi:pimeloyl-ACP methyl ester carboxylesterase
VIEAADGTEVRVTRGVVRVPVDRARPDGPTYALAVIRVHHPEGEAAGESGDRPASLFLAGGPGDSGVRVVTELARRGGAGLFTLLGSDLIGFDERGVGGSEPDLGGPVGFGMPVGGAWEHDTVLASLRERVAARADALRNAGIDPGSINVQDSADDAAAVCDAFGLARVTLWGRSYGSHLALAVDRRHPGLAARMVLVGPEGPDDTLKLPGRVDATLGRIGAAAGVADLPALMRRVLARLESAPHQATMELDGAPVALTIGRFDVEWLAWDAIDDPRRLGMLPALFARMDAGDFRGVEGLVAVRRRSLTAGTPMNHLIDISAGASDRRRARVAEERGEGVLADAVNFPTLELADAWGVGPVSADHRARAASPTPTLIVVGDLDARTPVENARELAAGMPDAGVVVVRNATHGFPLFAFPGVRAELARFLAGERARDAVVDAPAVRFAPVDPGG